MSVEGFPSRTTAGELSIFGKTVTLLAPCHHQLPNWNDLRDPNLRYRQRYLDMLVTKETNQVPVNSHCFCAHSCLSDFYCPCQNYIIFKKIFRRQKFCRSRNTCIESISRRCYCKTFYYHCNSPWRATPNENCPRIIFKGIPSSFFCCDFGILMM